MTPADGVIDATILQAAAPVPVDGSGTMLTVL